MKLSSTKSRFLTTITALFLVFFISACSRRPVLYNNQGTIKTSQKQDISECMELAKENGARTESQVSRSSKDAGIGAASGAAASAVGSAIYNGAVSGRSIGAGAGAGAVGSLVYRLFRKDSDPVFENYVNTCLRERGHQPIGWN